MGARPRGLVVAVSAPPGTDLDAIHQGVAEAAPADRHRRSWGAISREVATSPSR